MITQSELKKNLKYNPDTGLFTWICLKTGVTTNTIAGNVTKRGYVQICLNGKCYLAHRLAFLYMEGCIPEFVDHKKEIKSDNRWSQIRPATRSQNQHNQKKNSNNKSGFKGVCFHEGNFNYRAQIVINSEIKYLGSYESAHDAAFIYILAAIKFHGEFASY